MASPVPPWQGIGLYYDPLYKHLSPLQPLLRQAIDLPTMQRLRWIKQLSGVDMVFPGATHNRLEHSIGVFHLAGLAFDTLQQRQWVEQRSEPWLDGIHRLALQLAALFHDVGHGPYSHVFEMFTGRNPTSKIPAHEVTTERIITEGRPYPDIHEYLMRLHEQKKKKSAHADILLPENIAAIIRGKAPSTPEPRYYFLGQMISGIFDVDRMDYLQRDFLHIGVGVGYLDVWTLVHHFTLFKDDAMDGWVLKLLPEAAEALENMLEVRDLAHRRIYYHPTHRAIQEMLVRGMQDRFIGSDLPVDPQKLIGLKDSELLARLAEPVEKNNSADELEDIEKSLAQDIARRIEERDLYRPLPFSVDVYRDLSDKSRERLKKLRKSLDEELYIEWRQQERLASDRVGLPKNETVIFDIECAPVAPRSSYTQKVFYDEHAVDDSGKHLSLLDLLPHLRMQHGDPPKNEYDKVNHAVHERYVDEITQLFIYVPYEHIDTAVDSILSELGLESPGDEEIEAAGQKQVDAAVQKVVEKRFEPIIDIFLAFIEADDNTVLRDRALREIEYLLNSLIRTSRILS